MMLDLLECGCDTAVSFQPQQLATEGAVPTLSFELPDKLEASEPPEARGLDRDQVRLLVSYYRTDRIVDAQFHEIGRFLRAGDVLVLNTSGTLPAALNATRADGARLELHLSTRLPADLWSVELRRPSPEGAKPFFTAAPGERLSLPDGGGVTLLTPYRAGQRQTPDASVRLWLATLQLPQPLPDYLARHGFPIRYGYVRQPWPLSYYQTVFATVSGSAEMPSAGRAFTPALITQLAAQGVQIAPLLLHTGVASLEDHEPPYEEYYRVPATTAELVNRARARGSRIVAVGTTAVRALATTTDADGRSHPGEGWTDVVVTPDTGLTAVDGLLTGFHEPRATHLALLQALTGLPHLCLTYEHALREQYLWHEFGDLHLILPT